MVVCALGVDRTIDWYCDISLSVKSRVLVRRRVVFNFAEYTPTHIHGSVPFLPSSNVQRHYAWRMPEAESRPQRRRKQDLLSVSVVPL